LNHNWGQYSVLQLALPALVKGAIVIVGGLLLSWGAAILLRQIPVVGKTL
jgi:hypothetical protein